jgi:hypothetical protein
MTDEIIERTRQELENAIQAYMVAVHGPGVVVNWTTCAEMVDANDGRALYMGMNQNMTKWLLMGMSCYGMRIVQELIA